NGENGLRKIECILKQKLIDGSSGLVGFAAFGDANFAIALRIDIEPTAREQHALSAGKKLCNPRLQFGERNYNRQHSAGGHRVEIWCESALVIVRVGAGDGNGNRYGHGS